MADNTNHFALLDSKTDVTDSIAVKRCISAVGMA
jgi:hypothetical protein